MSTAANVNFDLLAEYNPLPETEEKPAKPTTAQTKPQKRPRRKSQTIPATHLPRLPSHEKGGRTMKSLRSLINVLNLHFAGVALLLILNLVLAVRLFLAWTTVRSAGADECHSSRPLCAPCNWK